MGSYVPTTAAEREEMLAAIGVKDLEGLYQSVPQEIQPSAFRGKIILHYKYFEATFIFEVLLLAIS